LTVKIGIFEEIAKNFEKYRKSLEIFLRLCYTICIIGLVCLVGGKYTEKGVILWQVEQLNTGLK
jgi:hypothetical protein